RGDAAILNLPLPDIHARTADGDAAITENAARTIKVDDGRPLLLFAMLLNLDVLRFRCAVLEGHVLQLALAARAAHRPVERMVTEQQLNRRLTRLLDLVGLGSHHHALS